MGCSVCNNLQPDEETPYRSTHIDALYSSSKDGCPHCSFILDASVHLNLSSPLPSNEEHPVFISLQPSTDFTIMWTTADKETKYIQIYCPLGYPPVWPGILQGLELSSSPYSDEAFTFIKAQLQECNTNHLQCKAPLQRPPTRLIDTKLTPGKYVRLIETASLPSPTEDRTDVPYIALSYCWGTSKTVTTVRANYRRHKDYILISELPKTLQDAITTTRRLGQRYLWIDALCIIQDDLADWEVESAQMADVYRNAYLTLAAGTAASSDEGFLQGRKHAAGEPNQSYQVPWPLDLKNGDGDMGNEGGKTILAARLLPYQAHSPIHPLSMVQNPLPLDTRGWTMQERLLSTRLLKFGQHELQWSCLSVPWRCECGHAEYPSPSVFSLRPISTIQSWTSNEPDPADPYRDKETQIMHLWQIWDSIVVEYMGRQLTQYLDKLPAVSGMAKVFRDLTGSKYAAGLWVDNFIRNLCWYLDKSEIDKIPMVGEYVAPSWSWASLGRKCSMKMHNEMLYPDARKFVPRAEVVEVETVTVGKNPLGRVSDGWVRMRGVLKRGVLVVNGENSEMTPVEMRYSVVFEGVNDVEVRVCPDALLEEFEVVDEVGEKRRSVRRASEGTKEDDKVSGSEVYLFLLGNFITINPRKVQSISLDFLVLGLSFRKGKKGVYERIGYGYSEPIIGGLQEEYVDMTEQKDITIE